MRVIRPTCKAHRRNQQREPRHDFATRSKSALQVSCRVQLHDQSLPYKYKLQALCFLPQIHTMAGNFTCLHLGNVIGHAVFFATVPLCMPQPAVDTMLLPLCIFAICHLVIFLVEDVRISCPNWINLWSTFMPLELPGGEHSRNVFQPREPIPSCAVSLGEGPVN